MTAPQTDATTDPETIIAALQQRLDAALSEKAALAEALATRNSEYGEGIKQQSATIDVLKVMSATPGDPQPVFDLIVRRATELCDGLAAALYQFDGSLVYFRAVYHAAPDPDRFAAVAAMFPMAPTREVIVCRAILDRQIVHIRDTQAEPGLSQVVRQRLRMSHRSQVSIPLMRDGQAIGAISLGGKEPGGFTDSQIALLETFAEQAVIAISSAETYRNLHEALEQQTATAEVLEVINASPGNLAPVLDAMLEKATRLCDAAFGDLLIYNSEAFHRAAMRGVTPAMAEFLREPIHPESEPGSALYRIVHGENILHQADITDNEVYRSGVRSRQILADLMGARTRLMVALRKDDILLGVFNIFRQEVRPFSDKQIALLENFAAQAVIAMENARLINEQREALEQQTATADVLQVINANPGNLVPVFDAILEKAHSLCGATVGSLVTYDSEFFRAVATHGFPEQHAETVRLPVRASARHHALLRGERYVQTPDLRAIELSAEDIIMRGLIEHTDARTRLMVPLRKDGTLLGFITAYRPEVRLFSDNEIALLENFAAQAVIAMENARLINEQREALEQQTATAEVLQVINANPGNLAPVFDAVLERAMRLCGAAFGSFYTYDGEQFHSAAQRGVPAAYAEFRAHNPPRPLPGGTRTRALETRRTIQVIDLKAEKLDGNPGARAMVELGGIRTMLSAPLCKDEAVLGLITVYRQEVRAFSEKQIALLENFAAQAVIAMENARLLGEIRQRQEELRITFESMGDGVAMFDETPRLVAWNRKFQDILDLPDGVLAERLTFAAYVRYLTERGEYGPGTDPEVQARRLTEQAGQYRAHERTRPDGRVIEVRHFPVAGGGFVLIYADITERKRNEAEIRASRDAAEEASRTIEAAYRDLKTAQANLIQAEKMASLGQLTAGIAHEIKNPLNFVNNFAELSVDLLGELKDAIAPAEPALSEKQRAEVEDVSAMLTSNLEKITEHGKRADGIVKAMLEHSRGSSGERRTVDLNVLIDEALNLAYHGARAQDQSFNITLDRDFAEGISPIEVNPQDMTRVFLNIFSNGFYATTNKARNDGDLGFVPTLKVTTRDTGDTVEIRVRDNGVGIPPDIRDKLFQPFFTTKPTGEGTGLGLSITYDIVTQQHGGTIAADSNVGEYSEFTIRLPRNP